MTQIRFHISKNGEHVHSTEWENETVRAGTGEHTGVARASQLRTQYGPEAAIEIDRRGDSRDPNKPILRRFRIKVGENTYYSKSFTEAERDKVLAAVKEMFPKGEFGEEIV